MIRLLGVLCSAQPHSPEDVDERISRTFPDPIDKWAMRDAQNALKDGKKNSTIVLPVDKILPLLRVNKKLFEMYLFLKIQMVVKLGIFKLRFSLVLAHAICTTLVTAMLV